MHQRVLPLFLYLASSAACGPQTSKDSASGSGDDSGGSSSSSGSDSDPNGSTTGTGAPDPTTGEPTTTTGEPAGCFPDVAPWTSLSAVTLALPAGLVAPSEANIMVPVADGNVALATLTDGDQQQSPVLLIVSPSGAVVSSSEGAPSEEVRPLHLARHLDGRLVLLLRRIEGTTMEPVLQRFTADGAAIGEAPLALPLATGELELSGDAALLAGFHKDSQTVRLAKFAIDTGALVWDVELGKVDELSVSQLAVLPDGGVLLAGGSGEGDQGPTQVLVRRFDADGGPVWQRAHDVPPFDGVSALELAPDGQAVILRSAIGNESVDLLSVDLGDGERRWEHTLAVKDDAGETRGRHLLVDADALSIPLMHTRPNEGWLDSLAVARISFTGSPLELVPLPEVASNPAPLFAVLSARGECGELVIFAGRDEPRWLGTFAP